MPESWWSQAHSVGLIAPNFSARVIRSDINGAGPAVLAAADCMRLAVPAVAARSLAVAVDTAAVAVAAVGIDQAAAH